MRYVMIEKIVEEIAFDNGCVNIYQSLPDIITKLYLVLSDYDEDFLSAVECYLSSLDLIELVTLASGTADEIDELCEEFEEIYGFAGLNMFLDELFEEAC